MRLPEVREKRRRPFFHSAEIAHKFSTVMLFASVVLAGHGIQPSNFLPHAYVLNGFWLAWLGSLYIFNVPVPVSVPVQVIMNSGIKGCIQHVWSVQLFKLTSRPSEKSYKNTQWREALPMWSVSLISLPRRWSDKTYEDTQRREAQQVWSVQLFKLTSRPSEKSYEDTRWRKS